MEAIVDRQVRQYQVSEYEKGQRATDYTTWLTSNVHYTAKFEEVSTTLYPCLQRASTWCCHAGDLSSLSLRRVVCSAYWSITLYDCLPV